MEYWAVKWNHRDEHCLAILEIWRKEYSFLNLCSLAVVFEYLETYNYITYIRGRKTLCTHEHVESGIPITSVTISAKEALLRLSQTAKSRPGFKEFMDKLDKNEQSA